MRIIKYLMFLCLISLSSCAEEQNVSSNSSTKGTRSEIQQLVFKQGDDLIKQYVKYWKRGEYKKMFALLSEDAQEETSFIKFKERLKSEQKINGGLKSISNLKKKEDDGYASTWSMTLNYNRTSAQSIKIRASLIKSNNKFLINSGGLIPLNTDIFDR